MGLALDEPKTGDRRIEKDGVVFAIGKDLLASLPEGAQLYVDFSRSWQTFSVRLSGYSYC